MEGLSEPLAPRTGRLLRRATVLHVTGEKRRVHPAVLHVGVPGGPATCLVLPATEPSDPGLRTDLVAALRVGARPPDGTEPLVWLTRLGGLELQDADAELNEDVGDAVGRLVAGKSAFALPFGKGDARKLVAAVTVSGVAPAGKPEWELVQELLTWRVEARKLLARWSSLSGEFGLEAPGPGVEPALKRVATWQAGIEEVRQLTFEFDGVTEAQLHDVAVKLANWGGNARA